MYKASSCSLGQNVLLMPQRNCVWDHCAQVGKSARWATLVSLKLKTICKEIKRTPLLSEQRYTYLHHTTDDHWQHVERKTKDVEECQWHKGLLGIKHVAFINQHIHCKSWQGHLKKMAATEGSLSKQLVKKRCVNMISCANKWASYLQTTNETHWGLRHMCKVSAHLACLP